LVLFGYHLWEWFIWNIYSSTNRCISSTRGDHLLTVFFIWPEGRLWGSVNGKCLTEAKAEGI
ncbi:hypothetical protein, partial [Bacillus mojavensis]|uniref:hypothetical protein n=1 Tax=Bacillus mojavensis TaxID=72360 RepID=UPI001C447835